MCFTQRRIELEVPSLDADNPGGNLPARHRSRLCASRQDIAPTLEQQGLTNIKGLLGAAKSPTHQKNPILNYLLGATHRLTGHPPSAEGTSA